MVERLFFMGVTVLLNEMVYTTSYFLFALKSIISNCDGMAWANRPWSFFTKLFRAGTTENIEIHFAGQAFRSREIHTIAVDKYLFFDRYFI